MDRTRAVTYIVSNACNVGNSAVLAARDNVGDTGITNNTGNACNRPPAA